MKRHVTARRERNRQIAAEDAKHRCGVCKVALPFKVFLLWGDPAKYCSQDCVDEADHRAVNRVRT